MRADFQGLGIGALMQQAIAERARLRGIEGLFVKSQRISTGYFSSQGYTPYSGIEGGYPYQYWKSIRTTVDL